MCIAAVLMASSVHKIINIPFFNFLFLFKDNLYRFFTSNQIKLGCLFNSDSFSATDVLRLRSKSSNSIFKIHLPKLLLYIFIYIWWRTKIAQNYNLCFGHFFDGLYILVGLSSSHPWPDANYGIWGPRSQILLEIPIANLWR